MNTLENLQEYEGEILHIDNMPQGVKIFKPEEHPSVMEDFNNVLRLNNEENPEPLIEEKRDEFGRTAEDIRFMNAIDNFPKDYEKILELKNDVELDVKFPSDAEINEIRELMKPIREINNKDNLIAIAKEIVVLCKLLIGGLESCNNKTKWALFYEMFCPNMTKNAYLFTNEIRSLYNTCTMCEEIINKIK